MIAANEQRFAEASIEGCTNHPIAMAIVSTTQLGSVMNLSASNDPVFNLNIPNLNTPGRGGRE